MNEPVILRIAAPAAAPPAAAPPAAAPPEILPGEPAADRCGQPRFPLVSLWFIAALVMQIALPQAIASAGTARERPGTLLLMSLWLGTMWAGWAGSLWVCSAWRSNLLGRLIAVSVVAAWHIFWMSETTGYSAARYAVMLGSYGVAQGIAFRLLGVANWNGSPLAIAAVSPARIQFGIADLIGLTAVVALLITAGNGYQHPAGEIYWWGLLVAEAMLLLVAALVVIAAQLSSRRHGRWLQLSVVIAILAAAGTLASLEPVIRTASPALVYLYAALLLTFAIWIGALANCGRAAGPRDPAAEPASAGEPLADRFG